MQTDLDFDPSVISKAISLVDLGIPRTVVGRRFGVPHYRVRFWAQRYGGMTVKQIAEAVQKHKPGKPKGVKNGNRTSAKG